MTIPQALQIALQHHHAGRLSEAEALYLGILAVQPRHAEALRLLGVIAQKAGRHDLAVEWIRQSIAVDPNYPGAHCILGESFHAIGRLEEAVAAYRRALELKPGHPEIHISLGVVLAEQSRFDEAIAAYRRAVELKPDYPEAYNNLGNALRAQGQLDEAVAAFRRALRLRPDTPEVYYNLGNALREHGQLDEAVASFRRALQFNPDFAEVHNDLSSALLEGSRVEEAIAASRRALELRPDYPEAYNNLGNALGAGGQLDEAIAMFHRALELKPQYLDARVNMGVALARRGELDEAIAAFRHALRIEPNHAWAHSNLVFAFHSHPGHDNKSISEEHQRWNRQFSDPVKQFVLPHANDRDPDRRLRIGYVSPDFRDHPAARYLLPLFERHDREPYEILCYSGVVSPDWMTERLRALAGGWRNTVGVTDARLAEMIREDGVDILVDLALHTSGNRLPVFARQPAPVQVAWLGYPGGTGLHNIGYRLTDARIDPPGEMRDCSAEEPVRMPDCWCCYDPVGETPEVSVLPALTAEGVTFGSLNNFAKMHEGVLALWARILDAVKESRLVMFCPEGRTRERVRAFFGTRGIVAERLELAGFLPRWEYLSLYQRIDIGLDPFPCNGMTTTCDALWMGTPVVTLPGETPVSRVGSSLVSSVGLGELAAPSEEDYVRIAVELAGDLPRLADLRATLRQRMQTSPLMDAPRFARNVEAAYRTMWERWRRGEVR